MADKTSHGEKLAREEAADRLEALAQEIRDGSGNVRVGNKTVELSPADSIAFEIGVRERSSLLRGNYETVTVKMDWKP
ncbi:amphi-Trp domain-containing protein [Halomarina litorea]|uniref:amphi-Trp domain-containing protein n=1 Tax=Halomarina litorea TaxID=2961595 RepID=UPI0020C369AF|nr:amphi-Trp domain-containing protein [Halomarina sp. BCD28]